MAKVIGDLALAMAGLGESVPVHVNGTEVEHILAQRNETGDLRLNLVTAVPEVAPAEDTDRSDRTEDIPDEVAAAENPAEVEKPRALLAPSEPQYLDDSSDRPL